MFEEAAEGFKNECPSEGRVNPQFPLPKMPLERPLVVSSADFSNNFAVLPGLLQDSDMGGRFR